MNAQEWLEELETKARSATPGPYILDGMYPIYSLGRGGLKDKTVACANSKFDGDYIVAACNAVPRLVKMVTSMSSVLAQAPGMDATPNEILQDIFDFTEPKE